MNLGEKILREVLDLQSGFSALFIPLVLWRFMNY